MMKSSRPTRAGMNIAEQLATLKEPARYGVVREPITLIQLPPRAGF